MFKFPSFNEQTGELGMQPELLCPRRSRFAPIIPLAARKFETRNPKSEIVKERGYIKEQFG
jgi:hypothetical protein